MRYVLYHQDRKMNTMMNHDTLSYAFLCALSTGVAYLYRDQVDFDLPNEDLPTINFFLASLVSGLTATGALLSTISRDGSRDTFNHNDEMAVKVLNVLSDDECEIIYHHAQSIFDALLQDKSNDDSFAQNMLGKLHQYITEFKDTELNNLDTYDAYSRPPEYDTHDVIRTIVHTIISSEPHLHVPDHHTNRLNSSESDVINRLSDIQQYTKLIVTDDNGIDERISQGSTASMTDDESSDDNSQSERSSEVDKKDQEDDSDVDGRSRPA